MNGLRNFLTALGPRKLMIMGGVALALLIGIGALAMRSGSSSEMGFLYTDLDPEAAQSISEKLKSQGVPFTLSADGTAVMAPVEKLPELRMAMASERLGGKIGYAVLDAEEPFGVSSSRAKINETRAIEGELSKSIESLDRVNKARVQLVMPQREMFSTQSRKATASVTLNTSGRLPREGVQSIRYLVASAVPELSPESVSIVDQKGTLLARAGEEGDAGLSDMEERQSAEEARLRSQVEQLIEPIVGQGKVRAEVAVVMNRDQTREEAEEFDPDKQVIAHQVTVESNDQNNEREAGADGATVATQLPDNQGDINGAGGPARQSARSETSEDTTFQNSRTHRVSVSAPGKVDRLTVAVMVDGGEKGLSQQQVQRMTRLVENAVGFDAERGDSVVVESMPFAAPEAMDGEGGLPFGITGGNILNLVEFLVLIGAALFGLRMFRNRKTEEERLAEIAAANGEIAIEGQTVGPDGEPIRQLDGGEDVPLLDQEIALAQVDGRIRLSALKTIGDAISANPAESASVIRQWMNA